MRRADGEDRIDAIHRVLQIAVVGFFGHRALLRCTVSAVIGMEDGEALSREIILLSSQSPAPCVDGWRDVAVIEDEEREGPRAFRNIENAADLESVAGVVDRMLHVGGILRDHPLENEPCPAQTHLRKMRNAEDGWERFE